jgi:hypothetical protein
MLGSITDTLTLTVEYANTNEFEVRLRALIGFDMVMPYARMVLTVRCKILRQRTLIVTNDVTRPLLCAHKVYVTVITHAHCYARAKQWACVFSVLAWQCSL